MSAMTLEELVGRQLVFGLPGPDAHGRRHPPLRGHEGRRRHALSAELRDAGAARALLARLESALGRRLLVTTDHEGGRIIMLGRAVTIFPDNLTAGTAGEVAFVHRQGIIEGRELRRLGVDVNFAPVLDVLTERYSPNIGIRSYGKDPTLVARYGAARIAGLQAAGISACAKHFPGKGHAPVDAHLGLPVIDSDWSEMHAVHLLPFMAAIEAGVDCLMTSHPLYPGLDPAPQMPATFSRLIVDEYLRGQVGYRGVVVSDDLEMGAIAGAVPDRRGDGPRRGGRARPPARLPHRGGPARRARGAAATPTARARSRSARSSRAWRDSTRSRPGAPIAADGGPARAERDGEALAKAMAARATTFVAPAAARLAAGPERPGRGDLPAAVVAGRPDHHRVRRAGRGPLSPRGNAALRRGARGPGGRRGADGGGDRPGARAGGGGRRDDPVPLRRASLPVEPAAARRAARRAPAPWPWC